MHNTHTPIEETLDDIRQAGVIVDTIAFADADPQLEDLAQMTGGNSEACPDGGSADCVTGAFTRSVTGRSESVGLSAVASIQVIFFIHLICEIRM